MSISGKFTGRDLTKFRERHDLTRPDLQSLIGMHRNTAYELERDDKDVPLHWRMALAALEAGLSPVNRSTNNAPARRRPAAA